MAIILCWALGQTALHTCLVLFKPYNSTCEVGVATLHLQTKDQKGSESLIRTREPRIKLGLNPTQDQELPLEGISDPPRLLEDQAWDESSAASRACRHKSQKHPREHTALLGGGGLDRPGQNARPRRAEHRAPSVLRVTNSRRRGESWWLHVGTGCGNSS